MTEFKNIKLKRDVNFREIEHLVNKVLQGKTEKMQIPNSLSHSGGFGIEGAVLQLFATWLRHSDKQFLHTAIQTLKPDSFDDLCNSLFGLCMLRLSDRIFLSNMQEVALSEALSPAIPIFEKIRSQDFGPAFKGLYLALPAIKSLVIKGGRDREFDSPLYNLDEVVGAKKFRKLTYEALEAVEPRVASLDEDVISHVAEIIRELFTNTHRHARTDEIGNILGKNFRGIVFNSISLSQARLDELSKSGSPKLALSIGDWRPSEDKNFKALDITVVDSGPGYARRWHNTSKNALTIELESEAIIQCFTKHRSTDATDSSGSGLSNVLSDLRDLRGWFRLRTGRTLVEKSFFNKDGSTTISRRDIMPMEDFVEGVVFNILIPLESLLGTR